MLHVTDVGDGLCLAAGDWRWGQVQVDCGSQQGSRYAAERWLEASVGAPLQHAIKALVLSHYHVDHYNGFVWAANSHSRFPRLRNVTHIYSPGLPDPPVSVPLLRATLAFAAFTLGARSGIMEVDFRSLAQRLAGGRPIRHRRLFAGDLAHMPNGLPISVHWPPRALAPDTRDQIARAVREFERFIEAPDRRALKDLYGQARDLVQEDSQDEETIGDREESEPQERQLRELFDWTNDGELLGINRTLRAAANHLCIAFSIGSHSLCLGDLDNAALRVVVNDLATRHRVNFRHIVAPHHGTSWDDQLLQLRCRNVCVSVGDRLWPHVVPSLGQLGRNVHFTRLQGDIHYR